MLNELPGADGPLHLLAGNEEVVFAVLLAGPRRPRGVRHGEPEVRTVLVQQELQESRFSGTYERLKEIFVTYKKGFRF